MADETKATSDVKSAGPPPSEGPKTVGVLFVHGIGVQRRGDTLAQAGAALHGWLRGWLTQPAFERGNIKVELLDTSLAQPAADQPAHSRLVFRSEREISGRFLLLAESCWAESFRPPSYGEFVGWALLGFPLTVVLHMLSTFRRTLRIGLTAGEAVERRLLTLDDRRQLEADLGLDQGTIPVEAQALRKFLDQQAIRGLTRWLMSPFLFAFLLFASIVVQVLLLALLLIGLLPIGFIRDFVSRVQRTVSAVLGDSYLFVASPISASAAVTQVKKDFQWLAERCDRVVLLAHSQGAAVALRAVEEWSWEGQVPAKLKLLITYGSGLQKLFALKELLSRDQSPTHALASTKGGVLAVLGSIGILTPWLWITGAVPWWVAVPGITLGFVLLSVALMFFEQAFKEAHPAMPEGVGWVNLYASGDPVCNGPTEVKQPTVAPTDVGALDAAVLFLNKEVQRLRLQQREVVNLDSVVADHTSYWSAGDDFVSRVARALLRVAEIPSPGTVDDEWITHGARRRRWRVGFRTGSRHTAFLAALCLAFWPGDVIKAFGGEVIGFISRALASLPKSMVPDWTLGATQYAGAIGAASLLLGIVGMYVVAVAGWTMWERREVGQFFRREEFRAPRAGLGLFGLGWLGVVALIPVATALVAGGETLRPTLWTLLPLLGISGWTIVTSGKGPNLFTTFIPWLLEQGELLLERKPASRSQELARARGYFRWAADRLLGQGDSMDLVRALLGGARGLEQAGLSGDDAAKGLKLLYEQALGSLERMGKNTGPVKQRLEELSLSTTATR